MRSNYVKLERKISSNQQFSVTKRVITLHNDICHKRTYVKLLITSLGAITEFTAAGQSEIHTHIPN